MGAPFEFAAELNEKIAEREQLQAEMAAEEKAKNAPSWKRSSRPSCAPN
jgi:hypothetical protein